jgi:hypothetical protein
MRALTLQNGHREVAAQRIVLSGALGLIRTPSPSSSGAGAEILGTLAALAVSHHSTNSPGGAVRTDLSYERPADCGSAAWPWLRASAPGSAQRPASGMQRAKRPCPRSSTRNSHNVCAAEGRSQGPALAFLQPLDAGAVRRGTVSQGIGDSDIMAMQAEDPDVSG